MARKSRKASTVEAPAAQATPQVSDAEILQRLQAEFASRPKPKVVTIQELYDQFVALIASATGKTFRTGAPQVSENTALKTLELALMWALNNRNGANQPVLPDLPDEPEGQADEAVDLPTPDEIIEAVATSDEE